MNGILVRLIFVGSLALFFACGESATSPSAPEPTAQPTAQPTPAPTPAPTPDPALRAGACAKVITPVVGENHTDPIYMSGFGNDRISTGVHDDIWARGVVLEAGGKKIAMVSLDIVGYFIEEIQRIRTAVEDLEFDAIVISSTHNHEGADTMGLWGPDQLTSGIDLGYLDFINTSVADCLREADEEKVLAEIRFATGDTRNTSLPPDTDLIADSVILQHLCVGGEFDEAGVCVDGLDVLGDPGPITNPTTPSFQVRDADSGDMIATLVNYASHPEALGADNTLISSDFPHAMREALEERFGGTAIYVSADLGVLQGPLAIHLEDPETGEEIPRRTFEFADAMGKILAERAGDALAAGDEWLSRPEIEASGSGRVEVEIENPYFIFLGELGVFGRREIRREEGDPPRYFISTEIGLVRVGPAQFVITPNELDPQIADTYRAAMTRADHRFVVGLGNDEIGYQMPEAKFNPSCFLCFQQDVFGTDPDGICPEATNDCSTVFQNNVGPTADPLFQGIVFDLLEEMNSASAQ